MATSAPMIAVDKQTVCWTFSTRIAFRFCFVYFGLYTVVQILPNQFDWVGRFEQWLLTPPISWVAARLFSASLPLVQTNGGSGDKTFDWVEMFCCLVLAVVATIVWSTLDRKRQGYPALFKWFRLLIRFALASQMLGYGLSKVIPMQMPFPPLTRLLEPYGNFSPMGVLWWSIGASPAYERFAGSAELLGGILLILPRTTLLGALVSLADMVQVFTLNMTYDVPVKLLSLHLLLMALFLLAPDVPRLANFFLLNRDAPPSSQPQLFATARANRIAFAAQILLGTLLAGLSLSSVLSQWKMYGGGRPKSPLYGVWNVEQFSIDGQIREPVLSDRDRWRRVIFDFTTQMNYQRMDDSFAGYLTSFDVSASKVTFTRQGDKNWKADFGFQRSGDDQLVLDGEMDGHKVHALLRLFDRNKFLLVSRGFHWIQEYPFNR